MEDSNAVRDLPRGMAWEPIEEPSLRLCRKDGSDSLQPVRHQLVHQWIPKVV